MDVPATARPKAPYGLSFSVIDLLFLRSWAWQRGLHMEVLLDQVMDGAEFEELLVIRAGGRSRKALSIWRTEAGIIAQASGGQPKLFTGPQPLGVHYANLFAASTAGRSLWRQLLFPR